jgi:hypothetical protein
LSNVQAARSFWHCQDQKYLTICSYYLFYACLPFPVFGFNVPLFSIGLLDALGFLLGLLILCFLLSPFLPFVYSSVSSYYRWITSCFLRYMNRASSGLSMPLFLACGAIVEGWRDRQRPHQVYLLSLVGK